MYRYIVDHIPKNTPKNRRPGIKMVPEYITIHNTANPKSTAKNERGWLTNAYNKATASWHIAVDEKEAIEAIPLNEIAWHAGDGAKGPGNSKSISIEVCESGDQRKVWDNTVSLVAKMLIDRGWGVDRVRTHKSWSGKNCPRLILPRWDEFIQDIQAKLQDMQQGVKTEEISKWAVDAHKWVKESKISDGTKPKDFMTREQAWTMLYYFYIFLRGGK